MTEIRPNLKTRPEDYSGAEKAKMSTKGLSLVIKDVNSPANVTHQFMDPSFEQISDVAETLAKSYGIYTEFNRAATGEEKDWMYMLRITVPGGGPITRRQWEILDDVAGRYTASSTYTGEPVPSLRMTTRQNIQLHWVKKLDVIECVREIAESGFYTINGCGDNVRNVMGCPVSRFSSVFDSNRWAQMAGKYFRLPMASYIEIFGIDPAYLRQAGAPAVDGDDDGERFKYGPNLLNRKFKIAFSSINLEGDRYVADNCVELRTNDLGIAPILEDGKVRRFQVYVGGGQGEKQGYPTFAAMGQPLGIFDEAHLLKGLDAVVKVHQEWGDRQNRHWARMKYVVLKMGIGWYREQVREVSGLDFEMPIEDLDYGARHLHHGWMTQESNGLWSFGAFIENGRVIDGPNGKLRTMVRHLMDTFDVELLITPNQDLVFTNIPEGDKGRFEAEMQQFGYGSRNGRSYSKLRVLSGACVGRDTCRLTYTDSEKFEPTLIDGLEERWGGVHESIGMTGCERQCFRPATKTLGWVGSGYNLYMLKIGGTEDGRHQGGPLLDPNTGEMYLRLVPRSEVPKVTEALFEFYFANATPDELRDGGMGYFFRRVGPGPIIASLKANPQTTKLTVRTVKSPLAGDPGLANPSLTPARKQDGS
ncbi:MAG: nitrite/sulfite reductase [Thaumarchaeota archaeon]|nr:nitrite/sulfite reductase [Nitrososphaerota archaeon]